MLKKPLLVGKTKYDGPKNLGQIIRQIKKDLNNEVTEEYIKKVIFSAFLMKNLKPLASKYEKFHIFGCCSFIIKSQEKKRRVLHAIEAKERNRVSRNRKFMKYRKKWMAMKRLAKMNVIRQGINLKPIELRDFLKTDRYHKHKNIGKEFNLIRRKVTKK